MGKEEQGVSSDRYMIIPRSLIFLFRDKDILLLKGSPNKRLWANRYNGIGGHIEAGEDIYSAARRELYEETGISEANLCLCGLIMINTGQTTGIGIFVFKGNTIEKQLIPSHEGSLEWLPLRSIGDYPLVEDLYQLVPRVAAWQEGQTPFSALYTYDAENQLVIRFLDSA